MSPFVLCAALALLPQVQENLPRVRAGTEVKAGEVEVLVLDRKGRPVFDVRKDELTLLVDGEPVPIDWMEIPVKAEAKPEAPSEPVSPAIPVEPTPRPRHSTVFLVDEVHLAHGPRIWGLKALLRFVETLPEGEEAALVSLDGGIRLMEDFTTDRAQLRTSVHRLARRDSFSRYMNGAQAPFMMAAKQGVLANLVVLLDGIAKRPESKTVYVLAGPFSLMGLSPRQECLSGLCPRNGGWPTSFLAPARQVVDAALAARATLVAIDPAGLEPEGFDHPNLASFAYMSDTYALLAQATGGARRGYSNRPERLLTEEAELLASRYRIGFTPRDGSEGTRSTEVRIAREGFVVRTAVGYRPIGKTGRRTAP